MQHHFDVVDDKELNKHNDKKKQQLQSIRKLEKQQLLGIVIV
jgi:hypothetical protein